MRAAAEMFWAFLRILPGAGLCGLLLLPPALADPEAAAAGQDNAVWEEMPAGARTAYIGIHGGTVPVSLLTAGDGSPMIAQVGLTGSDFLNFLRSKGRLEEELFLNGGPAAPANTPADVSSNIPTGASADTSSDTPAGTQSGTSADTSSDTPANTQAGTPADPSAGKSATPAGNTSADTQTNPSADASAPDPGGARLALAGSAEGDIPVIYATGQAFERMTRVPKNWAPFGLTEKALSMEGEIKVLSSPGKRGRLSRQRTSAGQ